MNTDLIVNTDAIQSKIYTVRGLQVMLDKDLADYYQVGTKVLNQAVKRNKERFPVEFCFQLNREEVVLFKVTNCDLKRIRFFDITKCDIKLEITICDHFEPVTNCDQSTETPVIITFCFH